jgi:hypothetical protein
MSRARILLFYERGLACATVLSNPAALGISYQAIVEHISPPDGETDQAGFAPNQFFFVYRCDSAKNYRNINASITLLI